MAKVAIMAASRSHKTIFATSFGTDITGDDISGVQGDSRGDLRKSHGEVNGIDICHCFLHCQGATNGAVSVIVPSLGCTENGQYCVADKFVDCTVMRHYDFGHNPQVPIEHLDHLVGGEAFTEGCEPADVRHHDSHFSQVPPDRVRTLSVDDDSHTSVALATAARKLATWRPRLPRWAFRNRFLRSYFNFLLIFFLHIDDTKAYIKRWLK